MDVRGNGGESVRTFPQISGDGLRVPGRVSAEDDEERRDDDERQGEQKDPLEQKEYWNSERYTSNDDHGPPELLDGFRVGGTLATLECNQEGPGTESRRERDVHSWLCRGETVMLPLDETTGNRLAQALVVLSVVLLWAGLLVLAVNFDLRHTGTVLAGTPLDRSLVDGVVLAVLSIPVAYVAKQVGVRLGTYPPERGLF